MTNAMGPSRQDMLGVYLNDHLAGATAGSELASRMARSHRGREEAVPLSRLAVEIAPDPRLDAGRLDELIARGRSQAGQLEELRIWAASRVISDGSAPAPAALDRAADRKEPPGG
jgi:hypothetical protein